MKSKLRKLHKEKKIVFVNGSYSKHIRNKHETVDQVGSLTGTSNSSQALSNSYF
ncbi:hypothetical protein OAI86_00880 [Alphaproteobacteria bacterium]|nr:hypothetical protein [Alphaproteobacteria bacterium]